MTELWDREMVKSKTCRCELMRSFKKKKKKKKSVVKESRVCLFLYAGARPQIL